MPKYQRHRTSDEIQALAKEKGYTVDARPLDRGSDHIIVTMPGPEGKPIPVFYNVVNGRFFHAPSDRSSYFTSDRPDYDGQPWFEAMLDFFLVQRAA